MATFVVMKSQHVSPLSFNLYQRSVTGITVIPIDFLSAYTYKGLWTRVCQHRCPDHNVGDGLLRQSEIA